MDANEGKKLYTTHEVARMLGVTPITVIRWLDSGKFKCYTTVGGHRRIEHDELMRFVKAYNLPWKEESDKPVRKEFVILAVDDEPDVLEMIRDMLLGVPDLELLEVTNAFSAGAKLVEKHPDLILLDFLMPELDGFDFCQFVRQDPRFRDVAILAVSALKTETDRARMRKAGVDDILNKPFSADQLVEKVNKFRALRSEGNAT